MSSDAVTVVDVAANSIPPSPAAGVVRVKSEYLCSAADVAVRVIHTPTPASIATASANTTQPANTVVVDSSDNAEVTTEVSTAAAPSATEATNVANQQSQQHTKVRGQNKGSEREHVKFERSGDRPTFEGEINFLAGDTLTRVKCALRPVWHKRQRDEPNDDFSRAIAEGIAAEEAEKKKLSQAPRLPENDNVLVELAADNSAASEVVPVSPPAPTGPSITDNTKEGAGPTDVANDEDEAALAAIRAKRRDELSNISEPQKTTSDQKRANVAKRDEMFRNKLVLAPLTTVGNLPYRRICVEYGADTTLSEMALIFNLNKTQRSEWSLLRRHNTEGLFGLQVAVNRPSDAQLFAKAIEASGFSYDFIDINCGCPVELIVRSGCGCGLWEKKGKLRQVVQALVDYQSKPVTIKCRIGPDENDPQLHKHIGEYEEWGAAAVTIHGRSRKQRYTKLANWSYIEQCSRLTNLPVVGNGDIMGYSDVVQHSADSPNISSYMLGRGALIKPWAFKEIKEKSVLDPSSSERLDMLKKYCNYGLAHWGADEKGIQTTRKFLLEWLSFLHRYVPSGIVDSNHPQRINERPPAYRGRDELETLMASENVADWIKVSELLLGPTGDKFKFTPKHKSSSYSTSSTGGSTLTAETEGGADEG